MDSFTINTTIVVDVTWEEESKTEEQEKAREQFEEFIEFIANSMNNDLAKILVQSYEQAVRQETGMDIFQGRKIEVT